MSRYDLVIRDGRVLDGQGNPWFRADVAVENGRFVRIGRVPGCGRREIDAQDRYVSPGWIDMMDQSGAVLLRSGLADNKVRAGITTAIGGEDGTPVPAARVGDYFAQLQRQGISLNFGTYYGAGQARVEVLGDGGAPASAEQLEQMKGRVEQAMAAGAMGIATALVYPPDCFQTTDDLVALAGVAARRGGIYASHLRDESAGLLQGIGESIEIGERSGAQVEIFHFKAAYAPGWGRLAREAGGLIEGARGRGINIASNMYVYTAGGTGLDITVPSWVWEEGEAEGLRRLRDPAVRSRLKKELLAGSTPGWTNLIEACGGWERVVLANACNAEYDEPYRFKSIAAIAAALRQEPADVAWDILLAAQPQRAMALYFMMCEEDVETALRWPWMSIGSDAAASETPGQVDALGLPHPRSYGNFPRVIAEYVRKRQVLTLEDAIRKMTSWPAARMRLHDRGAIREGVRADVTIFDYSTIEDVATYDNPLAYPTGIHYVLVNGQVVVEQGQHTGAKPGMVLRGAGADPNASV